MGECDNTGMTNITTITRIDMRARESKKTVNGIISAVVAIALAVGIAGVGKWLIIIALVLHIGQMVWLYGREWQTEEEEAPGHTWTKPDYEKPKGDQIKER